MSRKTNRKVSEQTMDRAGPLADAPPAIAPGDGVALTQGEAGEITPVERAKLRVKCLEVAMITRTAAMPIKSHIVNAREIEAYVLDPECHLPVPVAEEESETK